MSDALGTPMQIRGEKRAKITAALLKPSFRRLRDVGSNLRSESVRRGDKSGVIERRGQT